MRIGRYVRYGRRPWGTFPLTDEPLEQPLGDLAAARKKHGVPAEEFVTLRHGAILYVDRSR